MSHEVSDPHDADKQQTDADRAAWHRRMTTLALVDKALDAETDDETLIDVMRLCASRLAESRKKNKKMPIR